MSMDTGVEQVEAQDAGDLSSAFTSAFSSSSAPPAEPESQSTSSVPQEETPVSKPQEVATEPERPVQQQQTAPVQAAGSDLTAQLRASASQFGIQVGENASSDDLALATLRRLNEVQPLLRYAQQLLPYADKIPQILSGQQQEAPKQAEPAEEAWTPESYFSKAWGGPQWDKRFDEAIAAGIVTRDADTGHWVPAPGYEVAASSIVSSLNEAQQHRSSFWSDFTKSNPYEKMYQTMLEPMQRAWKADMESYLEQREARRTQMDAIGQFENTNKSWMYTSDPVTGQSILTEKGQAFISTVEEIRANGISDPIKAIEYAQKIHGVQQQPAPVQQVIPAQSQQTQGVTGGTVAPPVQQSQQSFLDSALKRASHAGGSSAGAASSASPDMASQDLDSFFVRAMASCR